MLKFGGHGTAESMRSRFRRWRRRLGRTTLYHRRRRVTRRLFQLGEFAFQYRDRLGQVANAIGLGREHDRLRQQVDEAEEQTKDQDKRRRIAHAQHSGDEDVQPIKYRKDKDRDADPKPDERILLAQLMLAYQLERHQQQDKAEENRYDLLLEGNRHWTSPCAAAGELHAGQYL